MVYCFTVNLKHDLNKKTILGSSELSIDTQSPVSRLAIKYFYQKEKKLLRGHANNTNGRNHYLFSKVCDTSKGTSFPWTCG